MRITQSRLKECLAYAKESGAFTWNVSQGRCRKGSKAGSQNSKGYIFIKIDGRLYSAHRLAWLYVFGVEATSQIDHIDKDRTNNAIKNLREASQQENSQNLLPKKSISGLPGAHWDASEKRWRSCIRVYGKRKYLGIFDSAEQASSVYLRAKLEMHPFAVM